MCAPLWCELDFDLKSCLGYISESIKYRKVIFSRGTGRKCSFAVSWCDLDLTFGLAVVTISWICKV